MLVVRCKDCNREVSQSTQSKSCGCPNMVTIIGDVVTAVDLGRVIMIHSDKEELRGLSSKDLEWQEQRRKRKIRKLDFEVR